MADATDMRKSFTGLAGMVRDRLRDLALLQDYIERRLGPPNRGHLIADSQRVLFLIRPPAINIRPRRPSRRMSDGDDGGEVDDEVDSSESDPPRTK